jgi:hypothetical protein
MDEAVRRVLSQAKGSSGRAGWRAAEVASHLWCEAGRCGGVG